jgi:hypothetical protein
MFGALRACAEAWRASTCAAAVTRFGEEDLGCAGLVGARAVGAPCGSSLQCQSGYCALRREGACGTCAATATDPRPTTVGAACSARLGCGAFLDCVAGACRARPVEGEVCGDCAPYLSALCAGGRCVAPPIAADGQGCGSVNGPQTPLPLGCAPGSDCVNRNDFGAGRCAPLRREGDACTVYGDQTCQFPARCVRGRCALPDQDCR